MKRVTMKKTEIKAAKDQLKDYTNLLGLMSHEELIEEVKQQSSWQGSSESNLVSVVTKLIGWRIEQLFPEHRC